MITITCDEREVYKRGTFSFFIYQCPDRVVILIHQQKDTDTHNKSVNYMYIRKRKGVAILKALT